MADVAKKYEALGKYVDAMVDAMSAAGASEEFLRGVAISSGGAVRDWAGEDEELQKAIEDMFDDRIKQAISDIEAKETAEVSK